MNAVLILKLVLVPALIGLITVAGHRWGPAVAGWLSALPVVAGPILFFIAMERGSAFAASAAVGTLSAVLAILAFGIGYSRAAMRCSWPVSLGIGFVCYFGAVAGVTYWSPPLQFCLPAVALALVVAPRFYPSPPPAPAAGAVPANDIILRMAAGALLVLLVTHFAARMGPGLSGVFAMFPVMGSVVVAFSHRHSGPAFAIHLLRGMVLGYYAFGTFCVVLAMALPSINATAAFLLAAVAALSVQALSRLWLRRARARRRAESSASGEPIP
jgi:hypothetical protein